VPAKAKGVPRERVRYQRSWTVVTKPLPVQVQQVQQASKHFKGETRRLRRLQGVLSDASSEDGLSDQNVSLGNVQGVPSDASSEDGPCDQNVSLGNDHQHVQSEDGPHDQNVSLGNVKGVQPSDDGSCDQNVSRGNVQSTLQEDDLMKAKNDENNDETKVTKEKHDETKVTKAKMMSKKCEPYWWRKTESKNWSLDKKIKFCQKKLFHQLTRVADIPTVKGKKQNWKELRKTWRKCEMFLKSRYQKILAKQNARVSSRKSCPSLPQCPCCQNSSVQCSTKTTEKKSSNLN